MTTGEATVAALLAHGLDTLYALPGVHNDHFFDALPRHVRPRKSAWSTRRHEQGAAYMALGAALATGKPQAYCVVPGPGLLNSAAALLTAYGMNAPVLALIGQIPQDAYRPRLRRICTKIRDQAGIIARLVDWSARIRGAARRAAPRGRGRCARCSCGRPARRRSNAPSTSGGAPGRSRRRHRCPIPEPPIDEDAVLAAAKRLGAAKRPLIVAGGGAQERLGRGDAARA